MHSAFATFANFTALYKCATEFAIMTGENTVWSSVGRCRESLVLLAGAV